jgi:hypothetical protein
MAYYIITYITYIITQQVISILWSYTNYYKLPLHCKGLYLFAPPWKISEGAKKKISALRADLSAPLTINTSDATDLWDVVPHFLSHGYASVPTTF